jgi:hypothetical protein
MSTHPAPEFNPYAPPKAITPPLTSQPPPGYDPRVGLWRQGNILVMHKAAPLPDRCVKSNQPANGRTLRRNLRWHSPLVYLALLAHVLIYIILALCLSKTATIHIGLSEEWFARRRRVMIVSWSIVLLSVVLFVAGIALVGQQGDNIGPFLIIGGIFLFLGGAIYGLMAARLVSPTKMTDTHIWLKGVHPDYLANLPHWPYPY